MVHIQLQDAVAARLAELAKSQGLSLEAYLTKLSETIGNEEESQSSTITSEEFDRLLDGEVSTDSTYQGTYPRADIYLDHD
jgi:hypothetical protein